MPDWVSGLGPGSRVGAGRGALPRPLAEAPGPTELGDLWEELSMLKAAMQAWEASGRV